MSTTLYTGVPSITDGPQVYHTVTYDVSRNGTAVTIKFHLESWLAASTNYIGYGKSITFRARCVYNGITYTSNEDVYKYTTRYWCASASVPDYDLKDPKQTGHLTADVTLIVTNVVDTYLTITTETLRSDGTVKPGAHERTNSIQVGEVYPPAVPGFSAASATGQYIKSGDAVTLTAVNNGTGSGTLQYYRYQWSRNDGAWTGVYAPVDALPTHIDYPALAAGDNIRWRVGIESSIGLITYSQPSGYFYCASTPAQVTGVQASASPIVNPDDDVTFSWAVPVSGTGDIPPSLYKIQIYLPLLGYYTEITSATNSKTFKPSTYGYARGGIVKIKVAAQNTALLTGAYSAILETIVALLPSAPSAMIINNPTPTMDATISMAWTAAVPNTGTIKEYDIEYTYKPYNGAWSAWYDLDTVSAGIVLLAALSEHSEYANFAPNTQIKYRVKSVSSLDLVSATATESTVVTIQGGLASKKIDGHYQQGLVYFKDAGHWFYATNLYKKIAGHWTEGIG